MRSLRFGLLGSALFCCVLSPALARPPVRIVRPAERPELRAFWVDGFNDGFKTPGQCDLLLSRLRAMHANAVFVQMRKRADAYYQSHYEGWAMDNPAQFDSLAYLCTHAHELGKPRIQIHAWINACAVGGNASAGALTKLHPEWLSLSDTGADFDGEATKIDPGNPEAADWTFRVYLDVVRHYDVDGVHLDFIRYGGDSKTAGHWGYNAVSVARYNARYGTSGQPVFDDPRWQAWRREQVTNLVRRVYVSATALKPKLEVSAATICWGDAPKNDTAYETKSASYTEVFAPWRDWMREGILDLNCPMSYFTVPKSAAKWAGWNVFAKDRTYGRQCAMGVGAYLNPVPTTLALLQDSRAATAKGHKAAGAVVYCYDTPSGLNGIEQEGNTALFAAIPQVWTQDVPVPPMLWKEKPTTTAISGTLLEPDTLIPADGVQITLEDGHGHIFQRTATDGNGFFAFVNVKPGDYGLGFVPKFAADEDFRNQLCGVGVSVGSGSSVVLITPSHSGHYQSLIIAGISRLVEMRRDPVITLTNALVTSGSDRLGDHFFVADGFGQSPIEIDAPHLVPPVIAGDKVAIAGTLHHTPGGVVIEASAVRLVGCLLPRP